METHEHLVVDFVRFSSIAHGWRLSCITGRPLCAIHREIRLAKIAIVVERREGEKIVVTWSCRTRWLVRERPLQVQRELTDLARFVQPPKGRKLVPQFIYKSGNESRDA